MSDQLSPSRLYEIRTALDMISNLAELMAINETNASKKGMQESISSLAQHVNDSIHALLSQKRPPQSKVMKRPALLPSESPLKILVAEDNEICRQILEKALQKDGHTVTVVCDGAAAVRVAKHHQFDVVLLDIMMPVMNGIAAAKLIRTYYRELHCSPALIAVTAYEGSECNKQEIFLAFDGVIAKPLNLQSLRDILRQLPALSTAGQIAPSRAALEHTPPT